MLRSPGTKRHCVTPVPEEVLLKLQLLGMKLIWEVDHWVVYSEGLGHPVLTMKSVVDPEEWDFWLGKLADVACRNRRPIGWTNTQRVDTMPIEAAAVIHEEAFPNE
jgi:hypothetical protein